MPFAIRNGRDLQKHFGSVTTIDEFVQLILGLGLAPGATMTALGAALADTFVSRDGQFRASEFRNFARTLVDSASAFLDTHVAASEAALFPAEPRLFQQTRRWCHGLLANAFLGNVNGDPAGPRKPYNGGGLNFCRLFSSFSLVAEVATEKTKCLLQYFQSTQEQVNNPESRWMQELVTFERVSGLSSMESFRSLDAWNSVMLASQGDIEESAVNVVEEISVAGMENEKADVIVNFANATFGYGKFIASCTQEEILQMCCPEFNVGMMVYGEMPADTIILARNVCRFSRYSGYLDTFQFQGSTDVPYAQTILTMDASIFYNTKKPFSVDANLRDVRKAYLGFLSSALTSGRQNAEPDSTLHWDALSQRPTYPAHHRPVVISTGQWGCGAFGGDPVQKFLQQVIAACLCGFVDNDEDGEANRRAAVRLIFSSFCNATLKQTLDRVYHAARGLTPAQILDSVLTKSHLFQADGRSGRRNYDLVVHALEQVKRTPS